MLGPTCNRNLFLIQYYTRMKSDLFAMVQVNGHRLLGMNHIEVVTILKDLPVNVRMVCARRAADSQPYRLIDTSQDRAAFAARVSF